MGKLTVDNIDPNRFGRFPSDSDVKPGTEPVVLWISMMQDKGRSVVAGGNVHCKVTVERRISQVRIA